MSSTRVPIVVLSSKQDDVELINRLLRDAGHAAHCHWVQRLDQLVQSMSAHDPHLLWLFCERFAADVHAVASVKNTISATLPLIAVCESFTEADAAAAMAAGAHDLVSPSYKDRLCIVAERELRAFQLERALSSSIHSARQYKDQLRAFMQGSDDAIAYVHDGIIVEANQAWAELFGIDPDDVIGPLMDRFDPASHAVIKGALVASTKGQWTDEPLKVTATTESDTQLPLALLLESTIFDGEPAIKLSIPREFTENKTPEALLDQAISIDPSTGVYHRKRFTELLNEKLATVHSEGVRALAYLRPDRFRELADRVGPVASEELLMELADKLKELTHNNDLCGRFGGTVFLIWLDRGTMRDVEAWAEHAVAKIADLQMKVRGMTLKMTCTMGICEVGPHFQNIEDLIRGAESANQRGRKRGGNLTVLEDFTEETTRVRRFDASWVQQIKTALVENRFQMSRLAITSLNAASQTLYDTTLKLKDTKGDEIGASVFIPVASRHGLLRAIDRWVIRKALRMSIDPAGDCVFIRLSSDTLCDESIYAWIDQARKRQNAVPQRICFQIAEEVAAQYLSETIALAKRLRAMGFKFAIEHFGIGRDPARILSELTLDYLKIDGSLMQGLSDNKRQQERVGALIVQAHEHRVLTIAERVEDANTMAVLFQLGVGYVQGHYVHEPEVVLEDIYENAV